MTTLLERLTDLQVKHQIAVSEISSIPGCDNPDCNVHNTPNCSPNKTIQEIPTLSNCSPSKSVQEYPPIPKTNAVKRKEKEDVFSSPPTRKLSKNKRTNSNLELNFKINLSNKFNGLENLEPTIEPVAGTSTDKTAINLPSNKNLTGNNKTTQDDTSTKKLPPPVMLKITLIFRDQMKTLTDHMPQLRSKMTGEYFKLYCDTFDQYHELNSILELLKYEFYSITPKSECPIKVVIKGLPKDSKTLDIHNDLLDLGFIIDRVSQLTGRITNQLLPVFMVTLPRNINNANIFKVNKLSYLTVTVEGYDSKDYRIDQCYQYQKFNHTASNCHIQPKCLKCREAHQTANCQIKKVDTIYCVNCEAYRHMANYSKCPLYPKPRKGAVVKPNYSHVINSLVRPNTSFAQVAQQTQAIVKPSAPLKMTPHVGQIPITNQTQKLRLSECKFLPNPNR
ncbi:nucleic-acid-binding protein from transposon X-element [Trichonephila clavipes]|nr:nucleic-acid-binding protein from transposon X-element [Trichonephila clavipes]